MVRVNCNCFGSISITEDKRDIFFSIGKVSGLFYYILNKKIVSRDEVAGLFWPWSDEENAKISLRNALHKIRKSFNEDIILSPNKTTLVLNDRIDFNIDNEIFEKDPINNLELYKGEFLKGFYIKEATDFEYWLTEQRNYYKEKYIESMQDKIINSFDMKSYKNLDIDINNLLSMDIYNEVAYLYLMKLYKINGRNDKIINEYLNLQKILDYDLGVEPSDEIKQIYLASTESIKKIQNKISKEEEYFYYRDYELNLLQENLDNFFNGNDSKSILIRGESGIGKTTLKNKLLKNNKGKFNTFEVLCYNVEKTFSYSLWLKIIDFINADLKKNDSKKPLLWDDILKNLFFDGEKNKQPSVNILEKKENFNIDFIYNSIYGALDILSENKKILIVIEDIQWADIHSMNLLTNLILNSNKNVRFILTKSNEGEEREDRSLITLKELNKILLIDLYRFDKTEVGIIVRKIIRGKLITSEDIDNIFERSKGITFFLNEYIELFRKNKKDELLTSKIYDIFQDKLSNFTDEEISILKIISVFYGSVDIDNLLKILNMNTLELIKGLTSLVRMNILEEKKDKNKISINFVHSAFKNFMYSELNDSEKILIHKEIADTLEAQFITSSMDITTYIKLKYHYKRSNENLKALKYEVYILNYYLNFNHELFPNLDDYDLSKQVKLSIKNEKVLNLIDEIESQILIVKNSSKNFSNEEEISAIELLFLYCKGRYLIRGGNYFLGIKVMNRVIKFSQDLSDKKTELMGYKQMIIYGIQINDKDKMLKYIIPGIKVSKFRGDNNELAIFYRLYGVYYLMQGDFKEAERLFKKSIELFMNLDRIENSNSISTAANYNYIGEIRKSDFNYQEAMDYFNKAIELCINCKASCLSIFYINAGKTCYLMGNYDDMNRYLRLSEDILKQFDSYWRKAVLDAFIALNAFLNGEYNVALEYLKNAVIEVKTINNPRDIGVVYFVETIITKKIENLDKEKYIGLKGFLTEPSEVYHYKALKYLDKNRDRAEIEHLKKLRKKRE